MELSFLFYLNESGNATPGLRGKCLYPSSDLTSLEMKFSLTIARGEPDGHRIAEFLCSLSRKSVSQCTFSPPKPAFLCFLF